MSYQTDVPGWAEHWRSEVERVTTRQEGGTVNLNSYPDTPDTPREFPSAWMGGPTGQGQEFAPGASIPPRADEPPPAPPPASGLRRPIEQLGELAVLRLEPGDALVFTAHEGQRLTREYQHVISERLAERFPGVPVLFVEGGTIGVLRQTAGLRPLHEPDVTR